MKFLIPLFLLALSAFGNERLINGTVADQRDWPASVYASMGNSRCTSTVVGERVLLIAAHCVSNGGTAKFSAGGAQYTSKCTHAPDYDRAAWQSHKEAIEKGQVSTAETRNSTADWSLCVTDRVVTGIPYENINQDSSVLKTGEKLLLTGYGCLSPGGGGGGNDGKYRIGEATITGLPSGNSNDITTRGGAALCYGDSGGPAFYIRGQARFVVSVNSRGDIKIMSYLPSVSTSVAKAFFTDWSNRNNVQICGMHASAKGCRGAIIVPPGPTIFNLLAKTHQLKVTLGEGEKLSKELTTKVLKPYMDKLDKKGNP